MALENVTPTAEHRNIWFKKPILRIIYGDYYQRILNDCVRGSVIEIGSGTGNFKEYFPPAISCDIQVVDWIDVALDAHRLPFKENSIDNIVMVDTLHHLQAPVRFFEEVARVLKIGGRLIMVEPQISLLSYLAYKFFHPEPVHMSYNPFIDRPIDSVRDPFDSNQAIPHLLMTKYHSELEARFTNLKLIKYQSFSPFSYLLSGGFRKWSLIPMAWVAPILKYENMIAPAVSWISAFRLIAVLEKYEKTSVIS